ncbi:MAG: 2,3-bisphosphoglycerate-independent phosphoglycerate mutase [Firmicutes bacterium]|nr:2,3-bisphosphoglycerate-independent phosphoglycerate mutase [Bacillota bacterium]
MSAVNKVLFLIFDGLGDRPIPEFGYKTPLEAAATPNFDALAAKSMCGLSNALGRGIRPGSDVSHLAIFGYPMDKYYTGRGPIEVAGLGIRLQEGDVAFRGNFGTVDADWNILDRRAGRIRVVDEFAAAIDGLNIDGVEVIVKPGTAHRAGVVFRGKGLSANISDADPHEAGLPVMMVKPNDDTPEAAFTAQVINKFMQQSYEILENLPANHQRIMEGNLPANFMLLRGAGMYPTMPTFEEKYGLHACCIAGGGLYKGIGAFLGMDLVEVEGATALPDSDVKAKFVAAKQALADYDFVFTHVKATDSLAEDGNFMGKKEFIEKCDAAAAELLDLPEDVMLVVTADHSTACELMAHSADPVPIMFCTPHVRVDEVAEFGERAFAAGGAGRMVGADIMPEVMNIMGKLHLIGA